MTARRAALFLTAGALLTWGCGRRQLGPETIPLDRVTCARCGMVVSDAESAAEAVAADQETRFYDDAGCLAGDAAVRNGRWKLFVHRTASEGWLPAAEASFGRPARGSTPMGYGFRAYGSAEEARRADREGRAWPWAEVVAEVARHGEAGR
jgi:copper chaperone NosL